MSNYRPNIENPIPIVILIPKLESVSGVNKWIYPNIQRALNTKNSKGESINLFFGSFKTYGGTEKNVNGIYSIEDTAVIETWYRPDIKANCRIALVDSEEVYDILGEPENINRRNQFLKFKVRRVKGGA